ncbi:MAG: hypothetical protein MZU95_02280 [Desulfomicrobium escambiense]|nr:hypothetical protein [Desulfomicrobium escambiense]
MDFLTDESCGQCNPCREGLDEHARHPDRHLPGPRAGKATSSCWRRSGMIMQTASRSAAWGPRPPTRC